jgi:hypothetical protein
MTAVIEAEENHGIATCDIPNAFIQADIQATDADGNRTIMKIRGKLVDILCEMDNSYTEYPTEEHNQSVIYMHVRKALYGVLVSAMLFYRKLRDDLIEQDFEINPYDPCVVNKMHDGKQLTVCWHVDYLKASHQDPQVIDDFIQWLNIMNLPHDPHIASVVQQVCVGSNESNHTRDDGWTLVKAKTKGRKSYLIYITNSTPI